MWLLLGWELEALLTIVADAKMQLQLTTDDNQELFCKNIKSFKLEVDFAADRLLSRQISHFNHKLFDSTALTAQMMIPIASA